MIGGTRNWRGLRRYLLNTSWLMSERLVRAAVVLVVGVYVARYLGPEDFGVLSYATSFVALFAALASLGVDSILVRELISETNRRDELLGTVFCLKGAASVMTVVLVGGIALLIPHDDSTYWLIIMIAIGLMFQSMTIVDVYFQSRVEARYPVRVQLVQLVLSSFLKILLVVLEAPLYWFGAAILADSILMAAGLVFVYKQQRLSVAAWRYSHALAKRLLVSTWPLLLSGILVSVYMKIDQVFVKQLLGNQAIGEYAAAARLVEGVYLFPAVIAASLFPAIASARAADRTLYEKRLKRLHGLLAWLAVAISAPVALFSGEVIEIAFGEAFRAATDVLRIQIWASVFAFLGVASSQYLLAEDLTRISLLRTLIGCAASVLLNLALIPPLGIAGAAWATVISYALATLSVGLLRPGRRALSFIAAAFVPWKWCAGPTT